MGKQQPVKHYIDDTGAQGRWSANVREGQGAQINSEHAGFRARKEAMHSMDGHNDKNVEDRKGGDEPESVRPYKAERQEKSEGEREFNQTATSKKE